eukprot:g5652.t1
MPVAEGTNLAIGFRSLEAERPALGGSLLKRRGAGLYRLRDGGFCESRSRGPPPRGARAGTTLGRAGSATMPVYASHAWYRSTSRYVDGRVPWERHWNADAQHRCEFDTDCCEWDAERGVQVAASAKTLSAAITDILQACE